MGISTPYAFLPSHHSEVPVTSVRAMIQSSRTGFQNAWEGRLSQPVTDARERQIVKKAVRCSPIIPLQIREAMMSYNTKKSSL